MFGIDPIAARTSPAPSARATHSLLWLNRAPAAPSMGKASPPAAAMARGGCPPLDLAGRTINSPCPSWLGCSLEDFKIVRGLYVNEHNALVNMLDLWNAAVGAGKATWTTIPTAAYNVYEDSWAKLEKYPPDFGSGLLNTDSLFIKAPIVEFIDLAAKVHQVTCDVRLELINLGEQVPSLPVPPEEPKGMVEKAFEGGKELAGDLASGVVNVALGLGGAALLLGIGYAVYQSKRRP